MITSYMPIHHKEEYEGQQAEDRARAARVTHFADIFDIPVRTKADGDTTYLEASVSLPSLTKPLDSQHTAASLLGQTDKNLWNEYTRFLLSLERTNIGYLAHEVNAEAEKILLEELLPTGGHYYSLRYVDVDYRSPEPSRGATPENDYAIVTGYFYGEEPTVAYVPEGVSVLVVDYSRLGELPVTDCEYDELTTAISIGNGSRAAALVDEFLRRI